MEKVVKTLILTLVVLAVTGVANAIPVSPLITTTPDGAPAGTYSPYGNSLGNPDDVIWTYSWTVPDGFTSITSASLVVNHSGISGPGGGFAGEDHKLYVDNVFVKQLDYDNQTVINFLPDFLANLDGNMAMRIDFYTSAPDFYASTSTIESAVFSITYEVPEPEPEPEPPVVPAPAAVVLSSLGVGLVGWLRRRHMV